MGTAYGAYQIQQNYPPSGIIYRQGEMITHNGEEKKVVGYFGATKEVLDQGIDTNRELYYGDKKQRKAMQLHELEHIQSLKQRCLLPMRRRKPMITLPSVLRVLMRLFHRLT
jgi:hypothetical protein